jgi:hypothetical protein
VLQRLQRRRKESAWWQYNEGHYLLQPLFSAKFRQPRLHTSCKSTTYGRGALGSSVLHGSLTSSDCPTVSNPCSSYCPFLYTIVSSQMLLSRSRRANQSGSCSADQLHDLVELSDAASTQAMGSASQRLEPRTPS